MVEIQQEVCTHISEINDYYYYYKFSNVTITLLIGLLKKTEFTAVPSAYADHINWIMNYAWNIQLRLCLLVDTVNRCFLLFLIRHFNTVNQLAKNCTGANVIVIDRQMKKLLMEEILLYITRRLVKKYQG